MDALEQMALSIFCFINVLVCIYAQLAVWCYDCKCPRENMALDPWFYKQYKAPIFGSAVIVRCERACVIRVCVKTCFKVVFCYMCICMGEWRFGNMPVDTMFALVLQLSHESPVSLGCRQLVYI